MWFWNSFQIERRAGARILSWSLRGLWWLKIIVLSILYKLALVYFSFHSSYVVCFVMSLFKTTALPVCICKRRLARLRSLCTLILKPYELACSRSFPPPLPPFPLPSLPLNRLYIYSGMFIYVCASGYSFNISENMSPIIRLGYQKSNSMITFTIDFSFH